MGVLPTICTSTAPLRSCLLVLSTLSMIRVVATSSMFLSIYKNVLSLFQNFPFCAYSSFLRTRFYFSYVDVSVVSGLVCHPPHSPSLLGYCSPGALYSCSSGLSSSWVVSMVSSKSRLSYFSHVGRFVFSSFFQASWRIRSSCFLLVCLYEIRFWIACFLRLAFSLAAISV